MFFFQQDGFDLPSGKKKLTRRRSILSRKGSFMINSEDGGSIMRYVCLSGIKLLYFRCVGMRDSG